MKLVFHVSLYFFEVDDTIYLSIYFLYLNIPVHNFLIDHIVSYSSYQFVARKPERHHCRSLLYVYAINIQRKKKHNDRHSET